MATQLEVNKFLTEFEKKFRQSIPLLGQEEFFACVLEQTNRESYIVCLEDESLLEMFEQEESGPLSGFEFLENELDRIEAELDQDPGFRVLRIAFANWAGTTKELENIMLCVMDEMGFDLDDHPELIIEPVVEVKLNADELKALFSVVQEYTGPEVHRLYAMYIVRKLERVATGRPLLEKFAYLNKSSSEQELKTALAELGE